MKRARILTFLASVAAGALIAAVFHYGVMSAMAGPLARNDSPQSASTIASAVDRDISAAEKQIIDVAEAMPEDKYNFSPEGLKIPGSNYKDVRTFAQQVKHIAASNYAIW